MAPRASSTENSPENCTNPSRMHDRRPIASHAACASLSALLALLALAPRAYARCRRPAIAYVRILLSGVAVLAVDLPRMLPGDVAEVAAVVDAYRAK